MDRKWTFRVVIFRGRSHWVAQCLEKDVAAQARNLTDLLDRLRRALDAEVVLSQERNVEPFSMLPQAPTKFFSLWKGSEALPEQERWRDIHPLVVIEAARTATTMGAGE